MRTMKIVAGVLALLLVAVGGVVVIGFVVGESSMEDYCVAVSPGTPLQDVESSARDQGYRFHKGLEPKAGSDEHVSLLTSSATMGRFVCEVHHDGAKVRKTRFVHND